MSVKEWVVGAVLFGGLCAVGLRATWILAPRIQVAAAPDKLGWLDGRALTRAQLARLREIVGRVVPDDATAIDAAREGFGTTREDVELLRQDVRRAAAAYPTVDPDELLTGIWLPFQLSDHVPDSWNNGNAMATEEDGKWYLDGSAYFGVVKPEYGKRASAAEVASFYTEKRRRAHQARLDRDKLAWASGGTDGGESVWCARGRGCVVKQTSAAGTGTEWSFLFVSEEWADKSTWTIEEIKKMPAFAHATARAISAADMPIRVELRGGAVPFTMPVQVPNPQGPIVTTPMAR